MPLMVLPPRPCSVCELQRVCFSRRCAVDCAHVLHLHLLACVRAYVRPCVRFRCCMCEHVQGRGQACVMRSLLHTVLLRPGCPVLVHRHCCSSGGRTARSGAADRRSGRHSRVGNVPFCNGAC
jgi:hypothetical protein